MEASGGARFGALGGVVFVVSNLAGGMVSGDSPASNASVSEIAAYFADKASALQAGLLLFGLSAMALMWWAGSLWRWMERAEGGAARSALVSVLGLAVAGALAFTSSALSFAIGLRVDDVGDGLVVLHVFVVALVAATGVAIATHVIAATVLGARVRTMPRWLIAVGSLAAVGFLVSAVQGATAAGDATTAVGASAYALWCVWILGISYRMSIDARAGATVTA